MRTQQLASLAQQAQQADGSIDFSGNDLSSYTNAEIEYLINHLHTNNTNTNKISFKNCRLKYLPPSIGKFSQLTELNLEGNQLKKLPSTTGNLINLEVLRLTNNPLLTCIPKTLANLQNIKRIMLFNTSVRVLPVEVVARALINTAIHCQGSQDISPVDDMLIQYRTKNTVNGEGFVRVPLGFLSEYFPVTRDRKSVV